MRIQSEDLELSAPFRGSVAEPLDTNAARQTAFDRGFDEIRCEERERVVNPEASWMIVSSQLFEAYIECATKCWLRSRAELAEENTYAEWARAQSEAYRQDGLKHLLAILPENECAMGPPISKNSKDATWSVAFDVRLRTNDLESCLQAVERIPSEGRRGIARFIPYRFEFANKLAKKHKLLLAFDALLLSEALGREVNLGKIVHGDRDTHRSCRRKRSTQFLGRQCKRGEADMERFPRRPFGDHEPAPYPLRQLRDVFLEADAPTSRWAS
jgi:hypothetical protein